MDQECRERFPQHHGLAIPTCITARAVSFEVGGGENVPGIPGACTTRTFTYLVRGPCVTEWKKRNILPQWVSYDRPRCKHRTQWPLKGWWWHAELASTTEASGVCHRRSYPSSFWKIVTAGPLKISIHYGLWNNSRTLLKVFNSIIHFQH